MSTIDQELHNRLECLRQSMEEGKYLDELEDTRPWGGADVIVAPELDEELNKWLNDEPTVISTQFDTPRRQIIVTNHFLEISWLIYQLREVFKGYIDHISKFDFYGRVAQSVNALLQKNPSASARSLMEAGYEAALRFSWSYPPTADNGAKEL